MRNGVMQDPIETAALQQLLNTGSLPAETLVWREGMAQWAPARSLSEFATTTPLSSPSSPDPSPESVPPSANNPPPSSAPPIVAPNAPPPLVQGSDIADIEKNKIYAILAYIGLLFLVPLLAAPNSRFARYHTNQGIVLFLALTIGTIGSLIMMFIPFLGCLFTLAPFALMIGGFIFMILGIINAAGGHFKPLPLIGQYELLKVNR